MPRISIFAISLAISLALLVMLTPDKSMAGKAMELIMFEQEYCEWCEKWDEDNLAVYPKTSEGKVAPLRKVDIFQAIPEDLKSLRKTRFTPTFILLDEGKEVGRIRGYPGEAFFWGLLGQLIKKAQKNTTAKTAAPSAS